VAGRTEQFLKSLAPFSRVALDTSACIYYLQSESRRFALVRSVLDRAASGDLQIEIPGIVRLELLVRPYTTGDHSELGAIRRFVERIPGIVSPAIGHDVIDACAAVRAKTALKVPDALVAASAAIGRCQALIGNDLRYRRLNEVMSIRIMSRGATVNLPHYVHLDDFAEPAEKATGQR
jgi:predicted nucleic acid-binding protein